MVGSFTLVAPAVLAMAVAVPCVAQDPTMLGYMAGNGLIKGCTSVVQRDNALCIGYIIGVSDGCAGRTGDQRSAVWVASVPASWHDCRTGDEGGGPLP